MKGFKINIQREDNNEIIPMYIHENDLTKLTPEKLGDFVFQGIKKCDDVIEFRKKL